MNYVMTFEQYRDYTNGAKTLRQIKRERKEMEGLETLAGKLLSNDRLNKMTVFTIASLNYMSLVIADTSEAVAKIDKAGATFLSLMQSIGYWLCLIGCIIEILKIVLNGGSKEIGKIMMKYILFFGALFLMPFLFDLIKELFQ